MGFNLDMRKKVGIVLVGWMAAFAPWVASGAPLDGDSQVDGEKKAVVAPVRGIKNEMNRAHATTQIRSVVNSIKLYETQYAVLPIGNAGGEGVVSTDADLIDILSGKDRRNNPKETVFIRGSAAKKPAGGQLPSSGFVTEEDGSQRLVDPWGNEYAVIMDCDDDNQVNIPGFDEPRRAKVVCWSYGKPKNLKDPKSAKKNPPKEWIGS